jgi:hypothetical protein
MVLEEKETLVLRYKTYTYLLPMLGDNASNFKNVSAVFIGDDHKPSIKNKLLILTRMNKSWSEELHDWYINHTSFEGFYAVNEEYNIYVFNVPDEYKKNYFLFLEGKYSLFDEEYKTKILNFHLSARSVHHDNSDIEVLKQVLYKDEKLYLAMEKKLDVTIPRTQEIGSIYNKEKEFFNNKLFE